MIALGLLVILATVLVGLIIKVILDDLDCEHEITWAEYGVGSAIIAILIVPLSIYGGWQIAKNNAIIYQEYLNGWETGVQKETIACTLDGGCRYTYDCEPYEEMEVYSCDCGKNGCSTCTRMVTKYHSCPYEDAEYNYYVNTTLGSYTIATHRFTDYPMSHRWDDGNGHPYSDSMSQTIVDEAGIGDPLFWVAVKLRVDSGKPGPVTRFNRYKNFILASDTTILKQYSEAVGKYKRWGLLPGIKTNIYNFYYADKVYFVGTYDNEQEWQERLSYFNAAFGSDLHGDLHLVVVSDKRVIDNPDEYTNALHSYWSDKNIFDRHALPKNSIVVVVGVMDNKVKWARGFTGMPLGNEEMLVGIQSGLKGVGFATNTVVGSIGGVPRFPHGTAINTSHGSGVLEKVIFGIAEKRLAFKRVSMEAKNKANAGTGFAYLMREVEISKQNKVIIAIGTGFLSCLVWIVFACVSVRRRRNRRGYY